MVVNIAVIGAGVVGLSTAVIIQERIPGSKVKVIAEKFDEETTTYGSGGIFLPTLRAHPNESEEDMRRWCRKSWDFYSRLATGPEAGKCGAIVCSGYIVGEEEYADPLYRPILFNYRKMTEEELKRYHFPSTYKHGYRATTLILNPHRYLKWLMNRFSKNGGVCERRRVESLEELSGQYDIIVNCTGLGSLDLVKDTKVYPVRGQVIRMKAPWIKNWAASAESTTLIIPGEDYVTLGSVKQKGNFSMGPVQEDTQHILEKCLKMVPALKGAKIDHIWVGLRPGREKIRLEAEEIRDNHTTLKVVHNYGHYANGVALAWGTSMEAVDLVKEILSTQSKL